MLLETNYYINDISVRYFFWPKGSVKKLLRYTGAENRESLETSGVE